MSSNVLPEISAVDHDFARLWAESTAQVLEKLVSAPFTCTPRSPAAAEPAPDALWARFSVAGRLKGEFAFQISRPDSVRLTQMLMSEPADASVVFDESRADAFSEILRQFAGVASTACKSRFGGEVQFILQANAPPEWQPAARAPWVFAAPKIDPLEWMLSLSPELHAALEVPVAAPPPHEPAASQAFVPPSLQSDEASAPEAPDAPTPANLDLLLDVELEASLRFGQREMLLRDILDLHPGSVIELDRKVQEPAELIVSGRVIAHGEVVIVDGNYGLRITDIAQPGQRLQSLET